MPEKGVDIPLRIYADGVFDAFHIGHANMFKQCREAFPGKKIWLIAGVCDQEPIELYKGCSILTQVQPSAPKRKESKCAGNASGSMKCYPMPHGLSPRVTLMKLRIFERTRHRLCLP